MQTARPPSWNCPPPPTALNPTRFRTSARGTLDAASGGATQRSGAIEGRRLGPPSRRTGSPATERGRGEAHRQQKHEGSGGAADHGSGMSYSGQASGNHSTRHTQSDQADRDSHELCWLLGCGPAVGPRSDNCCPRRKYPEQLRCHHLRVRHLWEKSNPVSVPAGISLLLMGKIYQVSSSRHALAQ